MLRVLTVLFGLVLMMGTVAPAFAADAGGIAVVDLQALIVKSKAAQNIGEQLEAKRKTILKELSDKEAKLVAEEKKILEARKDLSEADFAKKVQAFEKERLALQKTSLEYRNVLAEASDKAERQLMDKVTQVVEQIATERQYSLVITKQNVIVGANSLEITDEALKRLDAAVSKIKVEFKK